MIEVVTSAIESLAKGRKLTNAEAFRVIHDRARAAAEQGETISRFWFEDGRYLKHRERRSNAKLGFAEELRRRLHQSDAGDVAD